VHIRLTIFCIFALTFAATTVRGETERTKERKAAVATQDAKKHDQLLNLKNTSKPAESTFFENFQPSTQPDKSNEQKKKDIVAESDILCFRGTATLVPKRAVIHVPERHARRLQLAPGAKLMTWSEFYAANRSWISVVEVSIDEAKGEKPFDEKRQEWLDSNSKVVVATLRRGPVSVLPLKEAQTE